MRSRSFNTRGLTLGQDSLHRAGPPSLLASRLPSRLHLEQASFSSATDPALPALAAAMPNLQTATCPAQHMHQTAPRGIGAEQTLWSGVRGCLELALCLPTGTAAVPIEAVVVEKASVSHVAAEPINKQAPTT